LKVLAVGPLVVLTVLAMIVVPCFLEDCGTAPGLVEVLQAGFLERLLVDRNMFVVVAVYVLSFDSEEMAMVEAAASEALGFPAIQNHL